MKFLILNGPNLNKLGERDPSVYGSRTYAELAQELTAFATQHGSEADVFQSNAEGELIDRLQAAPAKGFDAVIINPGAYAHYSFALADALRDCPLPAVEVHLSNIHARDEFRRVSVTAPACLGQISVLGFGGYIAAMFWFLRGASDGNA